MKLLFGLVLASATTAPSANEFPAFKQGSRILFQGDSITDGKRGRTADPNHILGHSYAFILAAKYGDDRAGRDLTFINRGISGNKVSDLAKRWQTDTLDLKPDILSILIGINDLTSGVAADEYEKQYDELLTKTVDALPGVKLVLIEPFGLPTGTRKADWDTYRAQLQKCQAIVEKLAGAHGAALVRVQAVFEDAVKRAPADHWIWDGVHPTYSGHQLIANEWDKVVSALP